MKQAEEETRRAAEMSISTPGQKEAALQEALAAIEVEQAEIEETELREELDRQFGALPEAGQLTPQGAHAPEVVLQETMAGVEEEREGEDDEATLQREARGTMLINLDLAKLHVTMPECRQLTSPVPVITLPPLQEQVVAEGVPMAAPLVQEQAAPEEIAPEEIAPEEAEMAGEEEPKERPVPDEAEFLYGPREADLSVTDRARLEEQRKQWDAEDRINRQKEHDKQIALQLQASEQQRAYRPVQLGLARRTVALPTEEELAHTERAFGDIVLGDDESTDAPPMQRDVQQAKEAYQPLLARSECSSPKRIL